MLFCFGYCVMWIGQRQWTNTHAKHLKCVVGCGGCAPDIERATAERGFSSGRPTAEHNHICPCSGPAACSYRTPSCRADHAFRRRCPLRRYGATYHTRPPASGQSSPLTLIVLVLSPVTFTSAVTASLLPLPGLIPGSVPSFNTLVTVQFRVDLRVVVQPRNTPITY